MARGVSRRVNPSPPRNMAVRRKLLNPIPQVDSFLREQGGKLGRSGSDRQAIMVGRQPTPDRTEVAGIHFPSMRSSRWWSIGHPSFSHYVRWNSGVSERKTSVDPLLNNPQNKGPCTFGWRGVPIQRRTAECLIPPEGDGMVFPDVVDQVFILVKHLPVQIRTEAAQVVDEFGVVLGQSGQSQFQRVVGGH